MSNGNDIEQQFLQYLDGQQDGCESTEIASVLNVDHNTITGVIKSLASFEMITVQDVDHFRYVLTEEGQQYAKSGSPEAQVFEKVASQDGIDMKELESILGSIGQIGFKQAMQQRWIALDKTDGKQIIRKQVDVIDDIVQKQLLDIEQGKEVDKKQLDILQKKR
eukprot:TRINITY_DN85715_c0_g1_i1.p1 TRINITY_DN85715_c0_g1~~TRINITY_DN85715_c0_g1_i1.p1  ORF type:complete len:164 (+),score=23.01 TRINITY_DN85715_c0_g1_i1:145-636(+)